MSGSDEEKRRSSQVKRDLKLSILTGPLTFIVPVLSYLFLYPIILSRSSLEVLGIWSLYVTTVSFFTVADIGFSQHLIREAGTDRDEEILIKLKKESALSKEILPAAWFIGDSDSFNIKKFIVQLCGKCLFIFCIILLCISACYRYNTAIIIFT